MPLAYVLAWLSVAGGNSVMPPWVRHQFPDAGRLVKKLRDEPCDDPSCSWCTERHNPTKELQRWFGFDDYRPEPSDENGNSLQKLIVTAAMRGEHVLGILPTGTGKSLCYQIPALSRFDKTGALTVVISPLVALMADQVAGLEAKGITSCAALNGLLSMPERSDVLDRVRLGDIGILIVSPEQLRNRAFRKVLAQREIGAWVLDEAHCISKWGHDFRPDYRYVGRFIKEKADDGPIPPILCLTATAKPDVIEDVVGHFRDKIGVTLKVFDGGANRTNLSFSVVSTTSGKKYAHIYSILEKELPESQEGGAIIYCATRKQTEEVAKFLKEKGLRADYFHANLPPQTKKDVQGQFIQGKLKVIAATNAFGMGIDKPDVRVVIHADIPGSLENYLQEAGRAGRDREEARCVLLYTQDDIERQFGMSARSRLTLSEIKAILRSVRRLDSHKHKQGNIIATSGEILAEEDEGVVTRDSATDDTRVRTALLWLEEAELLSREENFVQIFPSSLRVSSIDEANKKLDKIQEPKYRKQLISLIQNLIGANADEGISTDELMAVSGLNTEELRRAFFDLENLGIASNDTALTAYVHVGVANNSKKLLDQAEQLETALINLMREEHGELGQGDASVLQTRVDAQRLKDMNVERVFPEFVRRIIRSLSMDGRNEIGGVGSLAIKNLDRERIQVTLQRSWPYTEQTASIRRKAARLILEYLVSTIPSGHKGKDLLAETTIGELVRVLDNDIELKSMQLNTQKVLDRSLLWLHEMEVIRLNKGLAVFRPAMILHIKEGKKNFLKTDFQILQGHYDEQVLQIHVMAAYAEHGLETMAEALRLSMDYFLLKQDDFIKKWMPGHEKQLELQTTPESWQRIVESLNNKTQEKIVSDTREQTNVLVLAGPGSGKTKVLVHRIAYLIRVRRENPRGIIALAYNRHAAIEIRRRLFDLIGDDAKGVTVLTCHALAMRLVGASFENRANMEGDVFKEVLDQAIALLKGEDLPPEDVDVQRDRLLSGFRWILVDEYQDIGEEQYELIASLAGRTLDEDRQLTLFAVGDDDQNIYAFNGASVEYIRRFEDDYKAKPSYLTENYRSTRHIIDASNAMIAPALERMKVYHPITINAVRESEKPGGTWEGIDPVTKGRVNILQANSNPIDQAIMVMQELQRLASLKDNWDWSTTAVIARDWRSLDSVRAYCEKHTIPVQMANDDMPQFWRLRETQEFVQWLRNRDSRLIDKDAINNWLKSCPKGYWWELLSEALAEYLIEVDESELPTHYLIEWLAEWGREVRRQQKGLLLLVAHRAKGLEFDHVAVLGGNWDRVGREEDQDSPRRLYYVAMTRAKETLTLIHAPNGSQLNNALIGHQSTLHHLDMGHRESNSGLNKHYQTLTMRDIDIGFAGRFNESNKVHKSIAYITTGDNLKVKNNNGKWELTDENGHVVGRLSRAYQFPENTSLIRATVAAILTRSREMTDLQYQNNVSCDEWEIVLPEFVFEKHSN